MSVASTEQWEALAQSLIDPIVANPDAVKIDVKQEAKGVSIRATVHPDDAGRVIGSRGTTLSAIAQLVEFAGKRAGTPASITLADG